MTLKYPSVDWGVYRIAVYETLLGFATIVLAPVFYLVMFLYLNRKLFKGKAKNEQGHLIGVGRDGVDGSVVK